MNPSVYRVMVREYGEIKIITATPETLERLKDDPNIQVMGYMENMFDEVFRPKKNHL